MKKVLSKVINNKLLENFDWKNFEINFQFTTNFLIYRSTIKNIYFLNKKYKFIMRA